MNPEDLVAAVRARGSDATDLRDAAHEACHALDYGVAGEWTREAINDAAPVRSGKVSSELLARAVERRVCEHYRVGYSVEKWALIAAMESIKMDRVNMPLEAWLAGIAAAYSSDASRAMTVRVLALATALRAVVTP